uniref:Uncharacterized protein n=1 Tax=Caenorhabditis japonica TaxID=281687 RepID=A0A8R1DJY5_CAEJA
MANHSKEVIREKLSKEKSSEKDSEEKIDEILNPQKKRLEQLRLRKEREAALERPIGKSRSRPFSKEVTSKSPGKNLKMSAEAVDCEYDVEEEQVDEEIKNAKNETLKKLLMDKQRLEKALRLATENEKKLKDMQEAAVVWFGKYESILDDLDEQLTTYDSNRKTLVQNIITQAKPLCDNWKESRKTMTAMKFSGLGISTGSMFSSIAHYGISILRQILFAMAYCRDLISPSESPRNSNLSYRGISPKTS